MTAAATSESFSCVRSTSVLCDGDEGASAASPLSAFLLWREWLILQKFSVSLPLPSTVCSSGKSLRLRKPATDHRSESALPSMRVGGSYTPAVLEPPSLGPNPKSTKFLFVQRNSFDDARGEVPGDRITLYWQPHLLPRSVQELPFKKTTGECCWLVGSDNTRALQCVPTPSEVRWLLRITIKHEKGQRMAQLSNPRVEMLRGARAVTGTVEQECPAVPRPVPAFGGSAHLSLLAKAILVWLLWRTAPGWQENIAVTLAVLERAFPSVGLLRRSAASNLMREVAELISDPSNSIQVAFDPSDGDNEPHLMCKVSNAASQILLHSLMKYDRIADLHRCEYPYLRLRSLVDETGNDRGKCPLTGVYRVLRRVMQAPQLVVPMRSTVMSLIRLFAAYRWGEQTAESLAVKCVATFGLALCRGAPIDQWSLKSAVAAVMRQRGSAEREKAARVIYDAAASLLEGFQSDFSTSDPQLELPNASVAQTAQPAPLEASDALLDDLFGPTSDAEPPSGRNSAVGGEAIESYYGRMPKKLTIYDSAAGTVEIITDRRKIAEKWEAMRHQARQGGIPRCTHCGGPVHQPKQCAKLLRECIATRGLVGNLPAAVGTDDEVDIRPVTPSGALDDVLTLGAGSKVPVDEDQAGHEAEMQCVLNVHSHFAGRRRVTPLVTIWGEILQAVKQQPGWSSNGLLPKNWESTTLLSKDQEDFMRIVEKIFISASDPRLEAIKREVARRRADIELSVVSNSSRNEKRQRAAADAPAPRAVRQRVPTPSGAVSAGNQSTALPPIADVTALLTVRRHEPQWTCQFCGKVVVVDQFLHIQECTVAAMA